MATVLSCNHGEILCSDVGVAWEQARSLLLDSRISNIVVHPNPGARLWPEQLLRLKQMFPGLYVVYHWKIGFVVWSSVMTEAELWRQKENFSLSRLHAFCRAHDIRFHNNNGGY